MNSKILYQVFDNVVDNLTETTVLESLALWIGTDDLNDFLDFLSQQYNFDIDKQNGTIEFND